MEDTKEEYKFKRYTGHGQCAVQERAISRIQFCSQDVLNADNKAAPARLNKYKPT